MRIQMIFCQKPNRRFGKSAQSELFPNKNKALLSGHEIICYNKIATLSPFIDAELYYEPRDHH